VQGASYGMQASEFFVAGVVAPPQAPLTLRLLTSVKRSTICRFLYRSDADVSARTTTPPSSEASGDGVSELDQQPCHCGLHDRLHAVVARGMSGLVAGQRGEAVRGRPADQSACGHLGHPQPRHTGVRAAQHVKACLGQGRPHLGDELSNHIRHRSRLPARTQIMPPACPARMRRCRRRCRAAAGR
jgi:hypothetical protein